LDTLKSKHKSKNNSIEPQNSFSPSPLDDFFNLNKAVPFREFNVLSYTRQQCVLPANQNGIKLSLFEGIF